MTPEIKHLSGVVPLACVEPVEGATISAANIRPLTNGEPIYRRMKLIEWTPDMAGETE